MCPCRKTPLHCVYSHAVKLAADMSAIRAAPASHCDEGNGSMKANVDP